MSVYKTALITTLTSIFMLGCNNSDNSSKTASSLIAGSCMTECTSRLAIIAAFGQEADLLKKTLTDQQDVVIKGRSFTLGKLHNTPVVIVLSGISMSNATITTQVLLDHFNVSALVFSGIAGGVNPALKIGDVSIAKSWIAPNEIYYANSDETPAACGAVGDISCLGLSLKSGVAPFSVGMHLRETNVINDANYKKTVLNAKGSSYANGEMMFDFQVDSKLLAIAESVKTTTQSTLEKICPTTTTCYAPSIVTGERGASSGSFLANIQYRDYLFNTLKVNSVDMETTAVAQTAYTNQVPFIAFRSLSDLAGADYSPNVSAFFDSGIAQRNAAKLTIAFVDAWAKSK